MINFIDTSLYKDGVSIHIIVYSDCKDKAKNKIKALTSGEKIIEEKESQHEYRTIVEKGNIRISLRNMPLSTYARGHRSQFAIVDKAIIGLEHGHDIFYHSIFTKTMMYSHLLKDAENTKPSELIQIMLF